MGWLDRPGDSDTREFQGLTLHLQTSYVSIQIVMTVSTTKPKEMEAGVQLMAKDSQVKYLLIIHSK